MLYNQATDLVTRQTVWVGTKVENLPTWTGAEWKSNGKGQSNSHKHGWNHDGTSAAELADLHTPWQGWVGPEAKRISFPA